MLRDVTRSSSGTQKHSHQHGHWKIHSSFSDSASALEDIFLKTEKNAGTSDPAGPLPRSVRADVEKQAPWGHWLAHADMSSHSRDAREMVKVHLLD